MKYENAAKGLKKLLVAEILLLLAALAGAALMIITLTDFNLDALCFPCRLSSADSGTIVFLAAIGISAAAGIILSIVGYINALRDDKEFRKALFYVILYTASLMLSFFVINSSAAFTSVIAIGQIFWLFAMINALLGTKSIAEKRGDQTFVRKNRIMNIFISLFSIIAVLATVLSKVFMDYNLSGQLCIGMQLLSKTTFFIGNLLFLNHIFKTIKMIEG